MSSDESPDRSRGATYEHDDGVVDTVFLNDGDRVLVVREFPSLEEFDASIRTASYIGTNELVEGMAIPDPEEAQGEFSPDTDSEQK